VRDGIAQQSGPQDFIVSGTPLWRTRSKRLANLRTPVASGHHLKYAPPYNLFALCHRRSQIVVADRENGVFQIQDEIKIGNGLEQTLIVGSYAWQARLHTSNTLSSIGLA
jgi:hypothetical protein